MHGWSMLYGIFEYLTLLLASWILDHLGEEKLLDVQHGVMTANTSPFLSGGKLFALHDLDLPYEVQSQLRVAFAFMMPIMTVYQHLVLLLCNCIAVDRS